MNINDSILKASAKSAATGFANHTALMALVLLMMKQKKHESPEIFSTIVKALEEQSHVLIALAGKSDQHGNGLPVALKDAFESLLRFLREG